MNLQYKWQIDAECKWQIQMTNSNDKFKGQIQGTNCDQKVRYDIKDHWREI